MLKICQICSVVPPGRDSVGESALKIKSLLEKEGNSSIIVTSIHQDGTGSKGIIPYFKKWNIRQALSSINFMKINSVDLIIFHYPTSYYKRNLLVSLYPLIYRLFNFKIVAFIHEYSSYSIKGKIRIFPIIVFSNRIITTDHYNLDSISKIPGVRKKINMIPIGSIFSDSFFSSKDNKGKRKTIKKENKKYDLLYFGYIMHGKGLDILLDAFECNEILRERFTLNIVGNIPEVLNNETKLLVDKIGNNRLIKYWGYLDNNEFAEFIQSIDFACLPFINGVTIRRSSFMTAMAFGKPILTVVSKIKIEGLYNMNNVIFIDSPSKAALTKTLLLILKLDRQKIDEIGENAKKWYMQNYSERIFIDKILKVISNV